MTTRLEPLLAHLAGGDARRRAATTGRRSTATIYVCYPLDQVPTAGPLLSCIIAACIKTVMRQPQRTPTLFALDEVPATALAKLDTYIATLGGYGGTLLLYLQTISQLDDVYGKAKAQTILGNCAHQAVLSAAAISRPPSTCRKLFGTELRYVRSDSRAAGRAVAGPELSRSHAPRGPQTSQSWSEKEAPVLAPTEVDALPADAVLVLAQATTQLRVLAERLNPIPILVTCRRRRRSGAPARP